MGDSARVHPNNGSSSPRIRQFWDRFLDAEPQSYQRGEWFDLFLAEALYQLSDGSSLPSDILSFGGSLSTLAEKISTELIGELEAAACSTSLDDGSGVINNGNWGEGGTTKPVLRGTNPRTLAEVQDALGVPGAKCPDALVEYLLAGRGWRCLALLHTLITLIPPDTVGWGEELGTVLMSVYTMVDTAAASSAPQHRISGSPDGNPYIVHHPPVDIEKICSFKFAAKFKSRSSTSHSSGMEGDTPPTGDSPPHRKISSCSLIKRSQKQSALERLRASSDSESLVNEKLNNRSSTVRIQRDYDYYSVRSGANILPESRNNGSCPQPQFLRHHSSGSVKKKLYPSEARDDRLSIVLSQTTNIHEWELLAVRVLQDLSRVVREGRLSVRLVTFSLDNLRTLQFGSEDPSVERKAAFTELFLFGLANALRDAEALREVVAKSSLTVLLMLVEDAVFKYPTAENRGPLGDFIFAIMYAVVTTVNSLLFQMSASEVRPYLREFVDGFKGRWATTAVLHVLEDRAKSIVFQLCHLVSNLKVVRAKTAHARMCKKSRHKNCEDVKCGHHHDDALGGPFPSAGAILRDDGEYCAVGSVFAVLCRLLTEEAASETVVRTLQAMEQCGACCCFPPAHLITRIVKIVQNKDFRSMNTALSALEKSLYRESGALTPQVEEPSCCPFCREQDRNWSCLDPFKNLLLSNDAELSSIVASHLLRVLPRATPGFQKRTLFHVFYPAFLAFKKKYESHRSEKDAYGVTVCLSAFAHLLGRVEFAREFLRVDGSSDQVIELMRHREFASLCTDVLRILIVTRVWSLEKSECPVIVDDNIKELYTLLNRVDDSKKHFLSAIKKLQGSLKENASESEIVFGKKSEWDNYTKRLEELNLYWTSLTDLCLNCPQIRDYCTRHLSIECYTLLVYFLSHIAKTITIEAEAVGNVEEKIFSANELQLKIFETLMIFSVVSPYSGNPGGVFDLKSKLEKVVESRLGLRAICDVLLCCSGANPSRKIVFPCHPLPRLIYLELNRSTNIDETNSDSAVSGSADEGYDADIEAQSIKYVKRESSFSGSQPPSRKISYTDGGERRFFKIYHPSLCRIVLHLIVYCYKGNCRSIKDCVYSLHKFGSLLRDKLDNCLCLVDNNFTIKLLTEFSPLLSQETSDPVQTELQYAVLEMFGYLARHSLRHQELALYIQYFTSDNPPLEALLSCLIKLLKCSVERPKVTVDFPQPYSDSSPTAGSSPANKLVASLHNQHFSLGFKNSWTRSCVLIPLGSELNWAMWVHGFSFAMWLNIEPPPSSLTSEFQINDQNMNVNRRSFERSRVIDYSFNADNLLHIISIGYEALVLEFWVDATKELLQVRMVRLDGGRLETLSQATVAQGMLKSRQWHHLALSVHDSIHAGKVIIQVTVIIDGEHEVQVPLTFKGLLVRKARTTCLMLGDTTAPQPQPGCDVVTPDQEDSRGRWETGGIVMWRRPVLDKPAARWLASLGPSDLYYTLVQPTAFPLVRQLQESLLLTYRAQMPDVVNVYPNPVSPPGGGMRNINETDRKNNRIRESSAVSVAFRVDPLRFGQLSANSHSTLATAAETLGGLPLFLFLLARVVELRRSKYESDEKCRARALEVYLRLVNSEPYLKCEEHQHSYARLVSWVLRSGPHPGEHTLNAILDTCCTGETKEDRRLNDAGMLVDLVLGTGSWGYWLRNGSAGTLLAFLRWLLELLRDDHPHREYNAAQLNQANFLDALLNFCKECMMEDTRVFEERELCGCLVEVMRGVMTAPPRSDHLTSIANYLLLSHPDYATYISHSRTSLYFVLPPHSPPSSRPKTKSRSMKLGLFGKAEHVKSKEYRHLFTQPVDPSKLNKALTNLQVKEGSVYEPSGGHSLSSDCQYMADQKEEACDSGIACGSYRNNQPETATENIIQPVDCEDTLSGISANTYFISEPSLGRDDSSEEQDNSTTVTSSSSVGEVDDTNDMTDYMPDIRENPESEGTNESLNGGYEAFRSGLFELLKDQLLMTPDSTLELLLQSSVLTPECFVVMANHHNSNITTAAIKVLEGYWERAGASERARFCKERGFYLLGVQLSSRDDVKASAQLADTLAGFITSKHRQPMSHQLDTDSPATLQTAFNLAALPPLLALLPRAVTNISLAHNIATFLRHLIKVVEWKEVLDYGLIEAVLKSIVALTHHSWIQPDHKILIYTDFHNLLSTMTSVILQSPGSAAVQSLLDVILQVEYVFRVETKSCGASSDCSLRLRRTQAFILQSCLNGILDIIFSSSQTFKSSFLSSVLSGSSDEIDSSLSSSVNSLTGQPTKLSRSDLNERFKVVLTEAVHFATYTEPLEDNVIHGVESEFEGEFVREVWKKVLMSLVSIIERKSMATRSQWSNVVWVTRDTVRSLSGQMFLWLMSPGHSKDLKMFAVQSILNEPRSRDILIYILSSSQVEEVCGLFVRNLLDGGSLTENERKTCTEFCSRLEEWCVPSVVKMFDASSSSRHSCSPASLIVDYTAQTEAAIAQAAKTRREWCNQLYSKIYKCVYKREGLAAEVLEFSKRVTRDVVARQSRLRKLQMENIKASNILKAHTLSKWRHIIKHLTHQRAVWHFPQSYPKSWQLDPTEGPSRVRNRLQRCRLNMDPNFFKLEYIQKLNGAKEPLSYLFEGAALMSDILVDRLHSNVKIRHMCQASVIVPASKLAGELLVGETALYFVPAFNNTESSVSVNDVDDFVAEEWPFECIKELHRRRYELQERALEIFLLNGKTYLVAFLSTQERESVMTVLMECELCARVVSEPLCDAVDLWRDGHLTNWQYLMTLNTLAGRSYNDLMQYPVFPFVLADYTSSTLDLTNPASYRNFKRPMAIQDKKNEQHYINQYNEQISEMGSYHYSSHYSNSGTVLHFLLRLPPFTSIFVSFQDNKFDWADRTFHSLNTTWRLTSSESMTDVKELIPEFFFLPEFLTNSEGFNFGSKQNGEPVDNVVLPPWAKDPRTFILVHRQALESDYVREELPHWIDLVFGYKQTGKAAVDSINVFHPSTYYGFDAESIEDPQIRAARQTMVRTYGQTPKQLFRSSHPMVVQSLQPKHQQPQVIPDVKGLNWGRYVGSPSEGSPVIVWQHRHQAIVACLVPLLTNDVFGLAPSTTLLLSYTKETPLNLVNGGGTCVLGAALVSWGHGDGVMRVKLRKEEAGFVVMAPSPGVGQHSVTVVSSAPDSNQLWIAYTSGKLLVYTYKFDGVGGSLELGKEPVSLVGHRSRILGVALSRSFSVALTTDSEGVAILWDMNTLQYIRSLPDISGTPIGLACISDTLGDIATVGDGSSLRVHTINGDLVGSVVVQLPSLRITSLCFSTAPEGTSVNVIAAGMSDFTIQLWSTWDLSPVGKIAVPGITKPIISLTYSHDSHQLYASSGDGVVIIWESSCGSLTRVTGVIPAQLTPQHHSKHHKFLNLTSLLS